MNKIEGSQTWKAYRTAAEVTIATKRARAKTPVADESLHKCWDSLYSGCDLMDTIRRAEEIMIHVDRLNWSFLEMPDLIAQVNQKIQETKSFEYSPESFAKYGLEDNIANAIREDCFKVGYSMEQANAIKHVLPCHPLMLDQVHGMPAPADALVNAIDQWETTFHTKIYVNHDYTKTPPVCARIALGIVQRQQNIAPNGFAWFSCAFSKNVSWEEQCLVREDFNCLCLEKCWEIALRRACEISDGCCHDMFQL